MESRLFRTERRPFCTKRRASIGETILCGYAPMNEAPLRKEGLPCGEDALPNGEEDLWSKKKRRREGEEEDRLIKEEDPIFAKRPGICVEIRAFHGTCFHLPLLFTIFHTIQPDPIRFVQYPFLIRLPFPSDLHKILHI